MLRAPSTTPDKSLATVEDANGNLLAFLYSRGQPMASLGALDNASTSEAFGINSHGTVVGDSQSGTQSHRPAMFSDGSVKDLGVGGSNDPDALETAYAINESGQIVGRHSVGENVFHAFALGKWQHDRFGHLGRSKWRGARRQQEWTSGWR